MKRETVLFIFCLFIFHMTYTQELSDSNFLSLVFAGDVMGHDSQINSAYNDSAKLYEYDSCFEYIAPFIHKADIAVANLEVTLAGEPFKGYPQFSSPDALGMALKNAGFDVLITANNHSLDRGKKGLERTVQMLDSFKIIHTGTFIDSVERERKYPLILEKNNIRLAILNYTYGTNGLVVDSPNIVNYIDTLLIMSDLTKADSACPDFTIVTMHWGKEYQRTENSYQRKLARMMLKQGADIIIGMHPHVVQPITKEYPDISDSSFFNIVVYSLGNYISNQRNRYTDGGIMFCFELMKVNDDTKMITYNYLPTWVFKPKKNNKTLFKIIPAVSHEKGLGENVIDDDSREAMKLFYDDTRSLLKDVSENSYFVE